MPYFDASLNIDKIYQPISGTLVSSITKTDINYSNEYIYILAQDLAVGTYFLNLYYNIKYVTYGINLGNFGWQNFKIYSNKAMYVTNAIQYNYAAGDSDTNFTLNKTNSQYPDTMVNFAKYFKIDNNGSAYTDSCYATLTVIFNIINADTTISFTGTYGSGNLNQLEAKVYNL